MSENKHVFTLIYTRRLCGKGYTNIQDWPLHAERLFIAAPNAEDEKRSTVSFLPARYSAHLCHPFIGGLLPCCHRRYHYLYSAFILVLYYQHLGQLWKRFVFLIKY